MVLDDIDKGRPTEYGAEQIFLAVDQRVTHGSSLLVTTNLGLDELRDRWPETYGPAIVSRLVGHCELVRIDGEDRRIAGRRACDQTNQRGAR
jgi:DNA replication protein DnaC